MTGSLLPFPEIKDESLFGGKSASLGAALRAGLPVPEGFGLDTELVAAIANKDEVAINLVKPLFRKLSGRLSVRSSAIGEDSGDASFAGQHLTVLNPSNEESLSDAIGQVYDSAHSKSALAYREKMGIEGSPKIAVALQRLIASQMSGVLFTRNPLTRDPEIYIEAAWGLGEVIVAGLVIPDAFKLSLDGDILQRVGGDKDLEIIPDPQGGTQKRSVEPERIESLCLSDTQLARLNQLALACEQHFGSALDIEWAFEQDQLYLLQCRAITTGA